jgi:transposase
MNYYAALDVALRSVQLCVVDGSGGIQAERQVDPEAEWIDAFLRTIGLPITSVGLDAGTLIQYLTYGLREIGYPEEIWRAT